MIMRKKMKEVTTMFSNLGIVRLPKEVEERIEMLEFFISPAAGLPYTFACITHGKVLALSITVDIEDSGIIERLSKRLAEDTFLP